MNIIITEAISSASKQLSACLSSCLTRHVGQTLTGYNIVQAVTFDWLPWLKHDSNDSMSRKGKSEWNSEPTSTNFLKLKMDASQRSTLHFFPCPGIALSLNKTNSCLISSLIASVLKSSHFQRYSSFYFAFPLQWLFLKGWKIKNLCPTMVPWRGAGPKHLVYNAFHSHCAPDKRSHRTDLDKVIKLMTVKSPEALPRSKQLNHIFQQKMTMHWSSHPKKL